MKSTEFKCQRCGNCCRWPGSVRLRPEETAPIAAFVGMPEFEFIQAYTHLTPDRQWLSLSEKPNGHCIFFDEESPGCRINPVKPRQCRDFPERWSFPGWEKECSGAWCSAPANRTSGRTDDRKTR
jgi:hypothetical protein